MKTLGYQLATTRYSSHMSNGILLTQHNQEIAQWSPDPFPRERVGSGHETSILVAAIHNGGSEALLRGCSHYANEPNIHMIGMPGNTGKKTTESDHLKKRHNQDETPHLPVTVVCARRSLVLRQKTSRLVIQKIIHFLINLNLC